MPKDNEFSSEENLPGSTDENENLPDEFEQLFDDVGEIPESEKFDSSELLGGLEGVIDGTSQVEMEFETEEGASVSEVLRFQGLSHFGKQGIIAQSPYLQNLNAEVIDLQKMIKQFKSNKIFRTVLENQEAKENYLSALKALVQELEEAEASL